MVASEAFPFSKTGGLADVASALARALGQLGHEVVLVTPRYRDGATGAVVGMVRGYVADAWYEGRLLEVTLGPGARALLVDCPPLFDRAGVYGDGPDEYPDNAARFAFLSIAALEWAAGQAEPPEVVHAHDWQAGLLPIYARTHFRDRLRPPAGRGTPSLDAIPLVFTIHNVAYQGLFDKAWVPRLGLGWEHFRIEGYEFWDRLSFLKAGVMFSDVLTTVSPTYALEIQRPEYGYGFDGVMRTRGDALVGILNRIDVDEWDPRRDPFLPAPFDADDLVGKRAAKRALLELFGLPSDEPARRRPIIAMIARMVEQKGLDLVAWNAPHLAGLDATFIVVGTGEPRFENMWRWLASVSPDRVGVHIGFDERRAHLVEAGADMFLMPSRYEPCGLNQMYSMRYGTIPIVRAVGGLADTVRPYDAKGGRGTGFVFTDYDPGALMDAIGRALAAYRQPRIWRKLQRNGMTQDFSWNRSAAEYLKVYKKAMAARRLSRSRARSAILPNRSSI
jgi:starch synthase